MANQTNLSQQDIQKLLSDPNEDTRAELTGKISSYYNSSKIAPNPKAIIDDVFR